MDPRIPVPPEATLIHGVTAVQVAGRRHFGEIAEEVRHLIGNRPVVGFNARHPAGFLDAEMCRHGRKTCYGATTHDIQAALRDAWGYRPTLSNAVTRLGIRREEGSRPVSNALVIARLARILASVPLDTLTNALGDRWIDEDGDHGAEPATRPQMAAIKSLGGDPEVVTSTRRAAEAIDALRRRQPEEAPALDPAKWVWIAVLGLAALAAWILL